MDLFATDTHTLPFKFPEEVEGCSYQWNEALQGFDIVVPHGRLFFAPNFFNRPLSKLG